MLGKAKTMPSVRSLEAADASYADAKALVARLKAASSKLDAEEAELHHRLASRPLAAEKTGRVAKLLGDIAPESVEAPDGVRARLKAIAAERIDLRAAVDIATQRLQAARFAASKKICEEISPIYAGHVREVAKALVAAHAAHRNLLALISDLGAADVAWTGAMAPMQAHGIFGHENGKIAGWLKEAASAGFIKAAEVPEELII